MRELESELQAASLELAEKKEELLRTQKDLQRQAAKQESIIESTLSSQIELLIKDAASPVAQLLTQAHLLSVDKREIQAKDFMPIALRLIRCLEDAGMEVEGAIGTSVPFDSSKHQLVGANDEAEEGREVLIRMPAILLKGQILQRMMVQLSANENISAAIKQEAL